MSTEIRRITFVVTPEIETSLNLIKKEKFYNQTQSDMIRELIRAGLKMLEFEKRKHQTT